MSTMAACSSGGGYFRIQLKHGGQYLDAAYCGNTITLIQVQTMRVAHVNYGDLFPLVPRLPRRPNSWTLTIATSPSVHPRLVSLVLHPRASRMEMTTRPSQSSRNGWLASDEWDQSSLSNNAVKVEQK
jgi:hypothetical protein